jgi:pantetheine-phosphate adenylyltransferase
MTAPAKRVGLYPGTFDPVTLGHLDIISRAVKLVDHLVIGVATNPSKAPLFSTGERVAMVRSEAAKEAAGRATVEVRPFDTLLVKFAESVGASMIIRGLRAVSDFEYEFQMVAMNQRLSSEIETVFLMADPQHQAIASRLVKEIAFLGGDIAPFTTPAVADALVKRCKEIR